MKRLLCTLVCVLMVFAAINAGMAKGKDKSGFTIKAGIDMDGETDATLSSNAGSIKLNNGNVDEGFCLSAEYFFGLGSHISFGPGITYEFPRSVNETWPRGEFQFITGYGALCLSIPTTGEVMPFFVGHFGYGHAMANSEFKTFQSDDPNLSIFNGRKASVSGGLYWGFGGGILLNNGIQIELLYNVNKGEAKMDTNTTTYGVAKLKSDYSKMTISIGYVF